jgi:hypothetical protein
MSERTGRVESFRTLHVLRSLDFILTIMRSQLLEFLKPGSAARIACRQGEDRLRVQSPVRGYFRVQKRCVDVCTKEAEIKIWRR